MKTKKLLLLSLVVLPLLLSTSAQARFDAGTFRLGLGLGFEDNAGGTVFAFGLSGGVLILKGFDVGISTTIQAGSGDYPTTFILTGDLRWILLPDMVFTPYIGASGGRVFVESNNDGFLAGPAGGIIYILGEHFALDLGVGYTWWFFPDQDPQGAFEFGLGLMAFF